jgi:uncharacterized protein GlcG (DUF336 family)
MITVTISVNGSPLITRSCRNTGREDAMGRTIYIVDDGKTIRHHRMDGAAVLAMKLLDGVHNIDADQTAETKHLEDQ